MGRRAAKSCPSYAHLCVVAMAWPALTLSSSSSINSISPFLVVLRSLSGEGFFFGFSFFAMFASYHLRIMPRRSVPLRSVGNQRYAHSRAVVAPSIFFPRPSRGRAFLRSDGGGGLHRGAGAAPPLCGSLCHEDRRRGSRSLRDNLIYYMTGSSTARRASGSQVGEKRGI